MEKILLDVTHSTAAVRQAASTSLGVIVQQEQLNVENVVQKLIQIYKKKLEVRFYFIFA